MSMRNRLLTGALLGAVLVSMSPAALRAEDQTMVLEMTKSLLPGGGEGRKATMTVTRASETAPMKIVWDYPDGTIMNGWGVPMPGTGQMAVSFGNGALALALYKRDGKNVDALWTPAADGSTIAPYKMKMGASDSEYILENGGGTFTIDMAEEGTGTAKWVLPSGVYTGLVIADGEYMAAASLAPGADAGVGIYSLDMQAMTASGRWTIPSMKGAGVEEYSVVSINGEKVGENPKAASPGASAPAADVAAVKTIAEELRLDLGKAQNYKPTKKQIAAITATDADADLLSAYLDKLYGSLPSGQPAGKEGQTEIQVAGPALSDLPGGYGQAAAHFDPAVKFYSFDYVVPGEKYGMSYDGLAQVGGKWAFFPKAWRAFEK